MPLSLMLSDHKRRQLQKAYIYELNAFIHMHTNIYLSMYIFRCIEICQDNIRYIPKHMVILYENIYVCPAIVSLLTIIHQQKFLSINDMIVCDWKISIWYMIFIIINKYSNHWNNIHYKTIKDCLDMSCAIQTIWWIMCQ